MIKARPASYDDLVKTTCSKIEKQLCEI